MLSPANESLPPIFALAAAIAKQQTPEQRRNMQAAFANPGQGIVPPRGDGNTILGRGQPPPGGPGQLSVPKAFNPAFPTSAAPADNTPPDDPMLQPQPGVSSPMVPIAPPNGGRFDPLQATPAAGRQRLFPGKMADDQALSNLPPGADPTTTGSIAPVDPIDRPGLLGRYLPPGLRNGIVDALAGLGASDPTASGLTTLGQAASGAQQSKMAREERKFRLATGAEALAYERGKDVRAEGRADKTLSLAERKATADERHAQLQEIMDAAGIRHTQAETRKLEREYANGGVSTKDMLDVEQRVIEYGKTLTAGNAYEAPDDATVKRNNGLMDDYRTKLIKSLKGGTAATPDAGPGGEVPMNDPSGAGTYDAPHTFPAGTDVRGAAEKLPSGAYFIGPDGVKRVRN